MLRFRGIQWAIITAFLLPALLATVAAGSTINELITELRRPLCEEQLPARFEGCIGGFGITSDRVSDEQLRAFLSDSGNRTFIETVTTQNQIGQSVHSLVYARQAYGGMEDVRVEKEFISDILTSTTFSVMQHFSAVSGLYFLNATLASASAMSTLLGGASVVLSFMDMVAGSYHMYVPLEDYFYERDRKDANESFEATYQTYGPSIDMVLAVRALRELSKDEKNEFGKYFFETRYQAWKLALSQDRRKAIANHVLNEIAPQPARSYSISGRVTSGSSSVPGVTVTLKDGSFRETSTTTNASGQYVFGGLQAGRFTVTPSKDGYTFNPPSRAITISSREITGQDFTASSSGVTPQPGQPTLLIDEGTSSQKQQLDTFRFTGSGFTPGARVIQNIRFPDGTLQQSETTLPSDGGGVLSWVFTPQCTSPLGRYTIWITDPHRGDSNYVYETITANPSCSQQPPPSTLPSLPPTATILVMDVSGSMGWTWKGGVKLDSAKEAALQFIEQVTNETRTRGGQHQIGVVAFSGGASVLLPLTSDYSRAKQVIISLSATNATNLGAGLVAGLGELDKTPSTTQRFVILLSDGETNTGLSRDQILNGPVVDARRKSVCIHTVAFGDPGDVDASFLRQIGTGSGCGSYSHAETAFELFGTYLGLRHKSLGQIVYEYSSIGRKVTILPGVPISLGTVLIGSGKNELHYTLAWSEQGQLQIRLKDPSGRLVTTSYPGAQIYTTDRFAHLTLFSPQSGTWTIEAAAGTSMPTGTEYYAVLSTRPGGIAIPLPLPIFTVGDWTFGLPSGLPTWFLVAISVALIGAGIYIELSSR